MIFNTIVIGRAKRSWDADVYTLHARFIVAPDSNAASKVALDNFAKLFPETFSDGNLRVNVVEYTEAELRDFIAINQKHEQAWQAEREATANANTIHGN